MDIFTYLFVECQMSTIYMLRELIETNVGDSGNVYGVCDTSSNDDI